MEMLSEMKQENNSRMLSHPNKRNSQQKKIYSKYSTRLLQNPSNKGTYGRRGPGLYRSTVNELSLEQTSLSLNLLHKRLFKFKPSLTPGLGTRRVVSINPRQDPNLKFSMEPRLGDEAFTEWINAVRRMARIGDGLPSAIRSRVWSTLADRQLAKQHVDWDHEIKMAFNEPSNQDDDRLGEQIVKDLHRTGCEQFGSDSDRASLKRVLLAYARWNKRVGYCQGFNVIAAGVLDVTGRDEKKAFKIMVYLIDYVLPESYFAQNLQALSVDIAVFRQLLQNRIPELANHLDNLQFKAALETDCQLTGRQLSTYKQDILSGKNHGAYEPPLMNVYIIQWFLTLFATCLASDAVLRVWDSILLEGSEVILRTAIVIMDFLKSRLLKLKSADQFYATMSNLMSEFSEGRIVSSQELIFEIYELAPFPYPGLKELREKFMYNIAPLVLTKHLTMNSFNNNTIDDQSLSNNDGKKMGKFNLFKYFPSNFKKSKSLQSDNDYRGLPKYLNKTTRSSKTTKDEYIKEIRHCDIKSSHCVQNTDKRRLSTTELNEEECMGDNYQEISLTMDIDSEIGTFSRKQAQNGQTSNTHFKEAHNKSINRFSSDQVRGTVKCFSAFWPDKPNNIDSRFSNQLYVSESSSVKSLQCSVNDTLPGNVFRLRNIESSPLKDGRVKANSDISQIGPGAVSDAPDLIPMHKTSSADQARMTRNLDQLKSQYKKQQTRQLSTIIVLPTNILKSVCYQTNMIAILPQRKYTPNKSSSFRLSNTNSHYPVKSISFDSYDTLGNCSENNLSEIDDKNNCNNSSLDILNKKINDTLNDSLSMCINQNIIGAVKSWQENADWSVTVDENDDPNKKFFLDELSGKELSIKHSNNTKLKLCELARFNSLETCLPMKYSYSDGTLNGHTTSNNHTDHIDYDVNSTNSLIYNKNIYDTNIIYSKKTINELILMNMIKEYNRLKEANNMYNLKESRITPTQSSVVVSHEAISLNDTDTSSCYTSVSRNVPKKLPWQEAAYSFALNCRLNKLITSKQTCELFPVKTSLTQSRREFGAKFGIY
ncbi:mediator complex subunit Med20 [Schistosoma haematobium]|uniref:Mediator complex subunit Med20 n=1 Tax=Schistosoma haematobium TaxID=6185 RepID=A0A922IPD4_SCHHA|nr:mediator complex subunit Med20 [Schistosoma haematobium]KAH9583165.1 mediator complex subunit Med20 [Schistosoma haematobium]CAH8585309.1 unnamed protein product [Schistosoma haematobium]